MTSVAPPLIAHVIYALNTGGLENGLVNIINRSPTGAFRHAIVCITTAGQFSDRITVPDVEVIEMRKRPGHDPKFYIELWRVFRKLDPDIIHTRNLAALETQLVGLLACPSAKRVHGEHGREANDLNGLNWKYLNFRRAMRCIVHRYIAVSRDLQQWLLQSVRVSPLKLRQFYNGVDHQLFFPSIVKTTTLLPISWQCIDDIVVIGAVGRLTEVKDHQLLLQALARLRTNQPKTKQNVRVVIVGDGPLRSELQRLIGSLNLDDAVWFTGDRDDVAELLRQFDLFVLPSLAEGVSNTLLEAMSTALPTVATRVGGNVELIEEGFNGRLTESGDSKSLARVILDLVQDPEEMFRLGNNARNRVVEEFAWDSTVENYCQLYSELLPTSLSNKRRTSRAKELV